MSTFSYAQAAKGVSGTPTPSKTPSESEKTDSKPEEQTAVETTTDDAPAPTESEPVEKSEVAAEESKDDDDFTTVTNKHAAKTKAIHSRTSSPSVRTGSKSRKSKDDDSNTPNGNIEAAAEKQAPSEGTEKAEGAAEKSTEKSEDSEKTASPPKELKAAPLPSVNIWQQRREAQDAKVKAVPKSASTSKAASKASTVDETQQDSKAGSKKKGADGAQEGAKDRKKTDGGKGRDAGSVPPVEDATAWPTPQVAIGEEKKKVQEKTDKSPVIRPHGKEKWTPVPYVPTAVFNTPLPSAGGRGGRRATRGGRDSGRGAHGNGASTTDKAASGQAAQGAKPASGDRGRHESGTGRAASLPAQSRRSPSADATAAADARKASQAPERGRGARNGEENKQVNGGENVPRSQREGKSFGRNQDARAGDRNQKGGNLAVDSQAAARGGRFEAGSKSADPAGLSEFNRERGEFRSERGGRGSNRGRGGAYNNFGGQNAQFNASMSNSFGAPKFGFNDRQRSQQHGLPNGAQQGNRMPLRSPSLPTPANMYGVVYPFPGDINAMYGYPAVNSAPMSAVPYQQQYVEPFSLMNMLSMQLEYYFSVDNMCKDMFLRKQMDSQGFVPLNVLASFKRVKSLTEDFELLRHVSRQLRNVECQTGEDGVDRLRPRDKWQQWVLPVDQREPAAQHDGAAPARKTDENTPVHSHENVINGSAPQFVPNGVAHDVKTSLSSTAPEFMPSLLPTAVNEIASVGNPWNSPVSPDASTTSFYSSSSSFPVDHSFIDNSSARGLDSQSEPPFPSDLEPTVAPVSFDADYSQHQIGGADWLINNSFAEAHQPAPKSNGKGRSSTETSNYVPKSFNMSHQETFDGRDRPVARRYSFGMTQHYQSWSSSLTKHFNSHLYNEFRRSALDDLLTRHIDNGFIELMEFYRNCLLHRRLNPDLVMYDLVHLSQDRTSHYHTLVSNTIHETIASGKMKLHNRGKISKYFNTQHGKKAREKLS
ncbi:Winged helix-turn-helix transcription repressor DNA-binding [Penicillium concentricum]|uniref:Winged helix-turn-helix transcription repressor DNA-binding n=1 Tax=Penicillium concentricum TaxID=293559 RepID=A0A9W9VJI5_9EURO|nr:Winged helix-turn-helix transcription repressor DNA-binding [Penicillium concentricum]KAJ5383154.1 Winged helix-turn-helix transcription repressor DNA-binding [Penicillium concentricum]